MGDRPLGDIRDLTRTFQRGIRSRERKRDGEMLVTPSGAAVENRCGRYSVFLIFLPELPLRDQIRLLRLPRREKERERETE